MIPMPLPKLFGAFKAPTLNVEQPQLATDFNEFGEAVIPAPVITMLKIIVHQASRKQVDRANLDHGTDWHAFYCETELRVADNTGPGYVIQYAGERWELMNLANYNDLGCMWMALGKRVE